MTDALDLQLSASQLAAIPRAAIDRQLATHGLREFVEMAWPQVEPAVPFRSNWHIDAICEHLEAVRRSEITRLVINQPPVTGKSLLACVMFPVHCWTQDPAKRFIYTAYGQDLSKRDALRHRRLIEGKWFQERWGHVCRPNTSDEWSAGMFSNDAGGWRLSTSVGGPATGYHADIQVADDPTKPRDVTGTLAVSKTTLEKVIVYWDETMSTRLADFEKSGRIIIMQRLHHGDLAGHVLREGGYEHLCLPMEYEPERKCMIETTGFEDPRTEPGELLCPDRFNEKAVQDLKTELGARGSAAQLQQNPSPAGGAVFKRDTFRFYTELPVLQKAKVIQSWDCSFKGTEQSDYVCGVVLARMGADYYLLDRHKERMSFSETCRALQAMTQKWKKAVAKVVEDKANGIAVVDHLRKKVPGLKLVTPLGGKEARANAVEPLFDAGNVHFPHPSIAPWIEDFMEELVAFPAGVNDDQVDALTQGLSYLHEGTTTTYKDAVSKMGQNGRSNGRRRTNGAGTNGHSRT